MSTKADTIINKVDFGVCSNHTCWNQNRGGKQIYLSNHRKDLKCFCDETELSTRIDVVPTVQIRFS
jgi:hypothetical protein